uniref:Uncharacterized protein n=1 Tax=Lotharella oceanica TaxID=641309 RepID=A0A7S2TN24_9EUKA
MKDEKLALGPGSFLPEGKDVTNMDPENVATQFDDFMDSLPFDLNRGADAGDGNSSTEDTFHREIRARAPPRDDTDPEVRKARKWFLFYYNMISEGGYRRLKRYLKCDMYNKTFAVSTESDSSDPFRDGDTARKRKKPYKFEGLVVGTSKHTDAEMRAMNDAALRAQAAFDDNEGFD